MKQVIQKQFYKPETKSYSNGLQVPLAFALWQHIVPDDEVQNVMASFDRQITVNQPYLGMGSSGLPVLLHFLAENRQWDDVVADHLTSESKPSYGYFLKLGETAWPEYWAVDKPSRMHTCYTGISAWFIKCVAGIQPDPENPGYQSFVIQPGIVRDLSWTEASVESPYGKIVSSWKRQKNQLQLVMVIPVNSTATIYVPTTNLKNLTEGKHTALSSPGLTFERMDGVYAVFHAESGRYQFTSDWK